MVNMSQDQNSPGQNKIYKINPSLINVSMNFDKKACEKNPLPASMVSNSIIDVTNSGISNSDTNFQVINCNKLII
jgi:hypothetical protein